MKLHYSQQATDSVWLNDRISAIGSLTWHIGAAT